MRLYGKHKQKNISQIQITYRKDCSIVSNNNILHKVHLLLKSSLDNTHPLPVSFDETEWDILYDILMQQKIFIIGYSLLKNYIPLQFKEKWHTAYLMLQLIIERRLLDAEKIQNILKKQGIDSCIAKGVALSQLVYDTPYYRQFNDLDIYVDKDNLLKAYSCLYENGYPFEVETHIPNNLYFNSEKYLSSAFELIFYPIENQKYKIEVKSADTGAFINEQLICTANKTHKNLYYHQHYISTVDDNICLFYLFTNTYKNNFYPWSQLHSRNIRDFYDIAFWILHHPNWDYSQFNFLVEENEVKEQINYVLSLTYALFNNIGNFMGQFIPNNDINADTELSKILDINYRRREYYHNITKKRSSNNSKIIKTNSFTQITMSENIPIKNQILTTRVFRDKNKQIIFYISGIPLNVNYYCKLILFDKTEKDPIKQRKNISFEIQNNKIEKFDSELTFIPPPQLNKNCIIISIPIHENLIFNVENSQTIFFEYYIYWNYSQRHLWMSIGGDCDPCNLILN